MENPIKQWCYDINANQTKVKFDYVFVAEESFKKYRPKSFKSIVDSFKEYRD